MIIHLLYKHQNGQLWYRICGDIQKYLTYIDLPDLYFLRSIIFVFAIKTKYEYHKKAQRISHYISTIITVYHGDLLTTRNVFFCNFLKHMNRPYVGVFSVQRWNFLSIFQNNCLLIFISKQKILSKIMV